MDTDALILVDAADRVVGRLSKSRCHEGKGVLHRAFSLLIFNTAGELLIQQRSPGKRLWPLYWSNSCCSHPRSGEDMETAMYAAFQAAMDALGIGFTTIGCMPDNGGVLLTIEEGEHARVSGVVK